MTKQKERSQLVDTIVGVVAVLAVLAFLVWAVVAVFSPKSAVKNATIKANEGLTRGNQATIECTFVKNSVKSGQKVNWTVNGKDAGQTTVTANKTRFFYTPTQQGKLNVSATVNGKSVTQVFDVGAPKLTLTTTDVSIVYGQECPNLRFTASGFVDDDCMDDCANVALCVDCDKLTVGKYQIKLKDDCYCKDYDLQLQPATLTVLPKQLKLDVALSKQYDQTDELRLPQTTALDGVVDGDEVFLSSNTLKFEDKNVGENKKIVNCDELLSGADKDNYALCPLQGQITAKPLVLQGLVVRDKPYDGTNNATIDKLGNLLGVCDGDSVAIGAIDAHFEQSGVGNQQIVVSNATLVGVDKDNYFLQRVETSFASITSSLWNKMFGQDKAIFSSNN